jgi:8-oxo-dGTP pyrophosphatase MutT (NUDIX family)
LPMRSREGLVNALQDYATSYPEELRFRNDFLELLRHPRAFHRDHLPGHITGSAWIVDESKKFVLLTHHAKLNRWLQPGGHADGVEDVIQVALREAVEETGLRSTKILNADQMFDIDIHPIPARNEFPSHLHYDVRIMVQVSMAEKFTVTAESHDLEWVSFHNLAEKTENNLSMLRMARKALLL